MLTSTIDWNYTEDLKPEVPEGQDSIVVIGARNRKGKQQTWMVRYQPDVGWIALRGHVVRNIYAWAYLPEPAPVLEEAAS